MTTDWSTWKLAGTVVFSGTMIGAGVTAGIVTYWRMEKPVVLPAVRDPKFSIIPAYKSIVLDVPAREYEFLGPFAFSTRTIDLRGNTVWSTEWTHYNPNVLYKFVTPSGLDPGLFSVMMVVDYRLNPVVRVEGQVKFLDLVITEEEK